MFLRWLASTASTSKPGNVKPANALLKSVSRKVCRLSMSGSSFGVKLYAALHNVEYDPFSKDRQGPKRPLAPIFAAQQYFNIRAIKAGGLKAHKRLDQRQPAVECRHCPAEVRALVPQEHGENGGIGHKQNPPLG